MDVQRFTKIYDRIVDNVNSVIHGKDDVVRLAMTAICAGGHILFEDVPGVGKSMLAVALGKSMRADTSRVQYTPDMLPGDITGSSIIDTKSMSFTFRPGPVFANVLLVDEINRATPKTQSALLEAMQDVSVSVGRTTYRLEQPFFVLATQNPLEMEGTYPLPEAQLDRFFFKLKVTYPTEEQMHAILERTTQTEQPTVSRVVDGAALLEMRSVARAVAIAKPVQSYAIRLTLGTHPDSPHASAMARRYVRYGASPRASQALVLAGKIHALTRGQAFVSPDDIRAVALPALRHRILLNFEGEADEVSTDAIVQELLAGVAP